MTPSPPVIKLSLKSVLIVQGLVGILLSGAIAAVWSFQLGASFALGMAIMWLNVLLLVWVWSRVLAKKSFALTSLIIVVKYTVLLGAIFFLSREAWFHVLGAGLGMASFILSVLIQAGRAKWE